MTKDENLAKYLAPVRAENFNEDKKFDSEICGHDSSDSLAYNDPSCIEKQNDQINPSDPRIEYLIFQKNLSNRIGEFVTEFNSLKKDSDFTGLELAEGYATAYRVRKKELLDSLENERQTKPLLWIGLTFIFTSILSQILGNLSSSVGTAINFAGNFSYTLSQASVIHP